MLDMLKMTLAINEAGDTVATQRAGAKYKGKLDNQKAREIRERASNGVPVSKLMEDYGIAMKTVYDCLSGRTWPDAGGPIREKGRRLKPLKPKVRHCMVKYERLDGLA